MLILIPGITGNLGHHLAKAALHRGHNVRGMGRTPDKLDSNIRPQLESFVVEGRGVDPGYDAACKDRAGIKRFHASSWNLDWENFPLGEIETYDSMLIFATHARLTSTIRPTYSLVGILANTLFGVPGAGAMEGENAIWARNTDGTRLVRVMGDGNARVNYCSESDAANFSVALITGDYGETGGFNRFCSDSFTFHELAAAFEKVRGGKVDVTQVMGLDECERQWRGMRAESLRKGELRQKWPEFVGLQYAWYTFGGSSVSAFEPVDAAKCPDVKRTSIVDYIRENEYV
ncbi:NAD(P)-binding domain protein [Metarhizium robertsii ARSEF 23]|uniref:NAD(P)-binding domain protein n=1 Tax=Metarhizium robertsii (strain ARSEF 23 / ATCC MYA-3075) TaxID=655844 RepID=E9FCV3_METRA|nr:NAD(P)-binding domain protein [Metarhizium robertsii ARSEF 23]EFY94425.1 NAD(P)-binding domain protein [Metarhizium robertsii ARSEF 23]